VRHDHEVLLGAGLEWLVLRFAGDAVFIVEGETAKRRVEQPVELPLQSKVVALDEVSLVGSAMQNTSDGLTI